ncbi:unnamed protein product, partial [Symbiodinium sp. KB8]
VCGDQDVPLADDPRSTSEQAVFKCQRCAAEHGWFGDVISEPLTEEEDTGTEISTRVRGDLLEDEREDTASVESEIHCDSCDEAVLCESRLRGFEDLGSVLRFMYCPWKVNLGRAASRLDSQIPDCRFWSGSRRIFTF